MKRFKFKLEPILQLRSAAAEQARRDYDAVCKELASAQVALNESKSQLAAVRGQLAATRQGTFSAHSQHDYLALIAQLSQSVFQSEELCSQKNFAVIQARNVLIESKQAESVLERLRSKAQMSYEQAMQRQEDQQMQELSILKFKR